MVSNWSDDGTILALVATAAFTRRGSVYPGIVGPVATIPAGACQPVCALGPDEHDGQGMRCRMGGTEKTDKGT